MNEQLQKYFESADWSDITYTATFVPTPQPKEKIPHPRLHWLISLSSSKTRNQVVTSYSEGVGFVFGYSYSEGAGFVFGCRPPTFGRRTVHDEEQQDCYRRTCETGKLYTNRNGTLYPNSVIKTQPAPAVSDVLSALISDADVLAYPDFESWANEIGENPDSRAAEKSYNLAVKNSHALVATLGLERFRTLQTLCEGD